MGGCVSKDKKATKVEADDQNTGFVFWFNFISALMCLIYDLETKIVIAGIVNGREITWLAKQIDLVADAF